MVALSVFKTYNARIDSGDVKRSELLDDWLQYGLYYGQTQFLEVHEFDNWALVVYDAAVLDEDFDPYPFDDAPKFLIYYPFGSRFRQAAVQGGFQAPAYNTSAMDDLKVTIKAFIDDVCTTNKYNGIFWDECDVGYWDTSYTQAGADIFLDVLEEMCDYARTKSISRPTASPSTGLNIINGAPYFAKAGEIFLLESFIGSYSGNAFAPSWNYNTFFRENSWSFETEGEAGGINWSSGIYPYLHVWKYAYTGPYKTVMYGHAYGDPNSPFQNDRQTHTWVAFRALGIDSLNYIDPANQHMRHLYMHTLYSGIPLETPQVDTATSIATRRYSAGEAVYNDVSPTLSAFTLNEATPAYWSVSDQEFIDVDWDAGETFAGHEFAQAYNVPEYLKCWKARAVDDRRHVYFKMQYNDTIVASDILPVYLWLEMDATANGKAVFLDTTTGSTFLEFIDMKAQVYIFGQSLYMWDGSADSSADDWTFLYEVPVEKGTESFTVTETDISFSATDDSINSTTTDFVAEGVRIGSRITITGATNADNNAEIIVGEVTTNKIIQEGTPTPLITEAAGSITLRWANDVMYYKIRKETLRHVAPGWDGTDFKFITGFAGATGAGFFLQSASDLTTTVDGGSEVDNAPSYTPTVPVAYVPHCGAIYDATSSPGNRVTQVTITATGTWNAWIFDRENGEFIGSDGTPDTPFTTSPFTPTKNIDATDIYVAVAHDGTTAAGDTFAISAVDVTTAAWGGSYTAGYDVPLPDLIEYESVYDDWYDVISAATTQRTYIPLGFARDGFSVIRDELRDGFTVKAQVNSTVVNALNSIDIRGIDVTVRRTKMDDDHTDPANTETLMTGKVDSWSYIDGVLSLVCKTHLADFGRIFPRRRLSAFCPLEFKGPLCKYVGGESSCDKTYTTCESYGNEVNFGGFKSLPKLLTGRW